jgi:hypothetical protein
VDDFAALTNKSITPSTRYLWFPKVEEDIVAGKAWVSES